MGVEKADDHQSQSRLRRARGQTEVLGVVLLLGITVISATVVVAFGSTALENARESAGDEGISHAMTQFDSRAAVVALGNENVQSIRLGGGSGGSYRVASDAGWMNISHVNRSAGNVETFLNASLGAVVYRSGDVDIAYQGGGVWRKGSGGSTMVSPPEFHYRDATLTLPLIQVNGNASSSGPVRASLTNELSARHVYPNTSELPYWPSDHRYQNPITEGNVTITIHSEYYQAWAEYFRTRSDGQVTEYDGNQTVKLTLATRGTLGEFNVPAVGDSVSVTGMAKPHPINNFTVTIHSVDTGNPFNNRHWSFYSSEDGQEFELHVYSDDGCSGGHDGRLDIGIYYYDGMSSEYHGWENENVDANTNDDFEVDCSDESITMNFTSDTELEYTSIDVNTGNAGWNYASQINGMPLTSQATFDQHAVDEGGARDGMYNESDGETESLGFLVNHYVSLLGPSFELNTNEGPGNSEEIDPGPSTGVLDYEQTGGNLITYLHVTENRIRVEFR